jgi:hypothetical protein
MSVTPCGSTDASASEAASLQQHPVRAPHQQGLHAQLELVARQVVGAEHRGHVLGLEADPEHLVVIRQLEATVAQRVGRQLADSESLAIGLVRNRRALDGRLGGCRSRLRLVGGLRTGGERRGRHDGDGADCTAE